MKRLRGAVLANAGLLAMTGLFAASTAPGDDLDARLAGANLKRGQLLYLQCQACHGLEPGGPHRGGPNLHGVFGRAAGTTEGFRYTDALVKSGIVWTPETMDRWLHKPGAMVPGNGMAFQGMANDADRASLIAWMLVRSVAP